MRMAVRVAKMVKVVMVVITSMVEVTMEVMVTMIEAMMFASGDENDDDKNDDANGRGENLVIVSTVEMS